MNDRTRYTLTIIDAAESGDAPAHVRLKGVLKRLLRSWGFRCTSVAEATPQQQDDADTVEASRDAGDAH